MVCRDSEGDCVWNVHVAEIDKQGNQYLVEKVIMNG